MLDLVQFIIFITILGTFIYYQKDKIIDKFSNINITAFEGFSGFSNFFSIENPKILSRNYKINEDLPIIMLDTENTFNNELSFYIQNYIPLRQSNDLSSLVDNLKIVNQRSNSLMLVQEDLFNDAIIARNDKIFKEPLKNLRFIAGLYFETFTLITYPDSGINSWKDLKGKVLGMPSKKSGSFHNGYKIAQAYGLEAGKDFRYLNVDSMNRLANLFFEKKIDAMYLTTSNKNPYIINLAKKMSLKFIGTNDIDEKIMKTYFPTDTIKYINTNNYYTNINTASFIKTFATRTILVGNKNLDTDYVYNLTKILFQRSEELKALVNNYLYNRDKLNLVQDAFMPSEMIYINNNIMYHKGAQKYFDETLEPISKPIT